MVPTPGRKNPASVKARQPNPPKAIQPEPHPKPGSKEAAPLEEGIMNPPKAAHRRRPSGNFGTLQYTQRNIKTDFAVADALQRVGRKISEDYPGIGEYVASIGEEFERMERCRVYMALRQKIMDKKPSSLERRIFVWRDGDEWCIDESAGQIILPSDEIFQVFANRTPTVEDRDVPIRLVFSNMDIDDDKCEINKRTWLRENSIAMMPFYYRDRRHASGVVVFEGDLRCKDSGVMGFSQVYWTARLAMEMAAQLSFQLTHGVDAITTLRRVQDFEVDIRSGIKDTVSRGEDLCLMLIDLDRFKGINDRHGYKGGNAVLREVAEVLRKSIRSDDSATRMGGDEFTIVLRNVSWAEAMSIAERILENIKKLAVPHNGDSISITCSMGAVNVKRVAEELGFTGNGPPTEEQVEQIYSKAFERSNGLLLQAKNGGRGRVLSA